MRIGANLAALKTQLKAQVDAGADACAEVHITLSPRMSAVYLKNVSDSIYYVSNYDEVSGVGPDASEVTYLATVAENEGVSMYQAAQFILYLDAAWAPINAAIERLRVPAKAAIELATSAAEARAAAEIDWSVIP